MPIAASMPQARRRSALPRLIGLLLARPDWLLLLSVLVLSSAAGSAMLAFRAYYSGTTGWFNLVWNLFLAWIPFGLAALILLLHRRHGHGHGHGRKATLTLLSLAFL